MESSESRKMKALSEMSLMDDALFSKCFDGENECSALMLRIILERDDLEVVEARTQRWIQNIENRSVKLDILAIDKDGKMYDVEIQKSDLRALERRARYYSAMMDADTLEKSKGYDRLPESYVIIITNEDVFRDGKAIYRIERRFEGSWKPYDDGTHIIHVCAVNADRDTDLGRLMHDLSCTEPEDMHYNRLRDRVSYYKRKKEGIAEMSGEIDKMIREGIIEGERRGLEKGRNEGRNEGRMETARNLIANGTVPLETIAECSGLSLEEVESMRNSIHA